MQASATSSQPGPAAQSHLKYRQVMDHVMNEIRSGGLKIAGRIPSINEISEEMNMARDTVERAYKELISKGLIYSVPSKGYFVSPESRSKIRPWVHMVLDSLTDSREMFVDGFLEEAQDRLGLTLTVYQENLRLMQTAVKNASSPSKYLVVLPHHFSSPEWVKDTLAHVSGEQLVVVENHAASGPGGHGAVAGDFYFATLQALNEVMSRLDRYQRVVLFTPDDFSFPVGIAQALETVCASRSIDFLVSYPEEDYTLSQGDLLFVLQENDLLHLIKDAAHRNMLPGQHIGIVSYQNNPYTEVLAGGITTLSLDYHAMGRQTAKMILEGEMRDSHPALQWEFRQSF